MALTRSLRVAMRSLLTNVGRTSLTMLGVAIGVAAVVLLLAIGIGVQASVVSQIEGLGSNLLFVFPGDISQQGPGGLGGLTKLFTLDQSRALRQQLVGAEAVVPVLQQTVGLRAANRTLQSRLAASTGDAENVFTARIVAGRHYSNAEVIANARVCDIAATVRQRLFPDTDPIGKPLQLNGQRFTVIGYYASQGGAFGGDLDNQVYVPVTTAQRLFDRKDIDYIVVKAADPSTMGDLKAQIERVMRRTYSGEFTVFTQEQTLGALLGILGTLTYAVGGIGAISLVVGGVGIMNIMLVSVTERTREIGVRKAVGARTSDILVQFVGEAVVLSVIGGVQGIVIAVIGAYFLRPYVPTLVTWWAVALAFAFSAGIGVFFGVYPAYKASRLEPVEALRYE